MSLGTVLIDMFLPLGTVLVDTFLLSCFVQLSWHRNHLAYMIRLKYVRWH